MKFRNEFCIVLLGACLGKKDSYFDDKQAMLIYFDNDFQ